MLIQDLPSKIIGVAIGIILHDENPLYNKGKSGGVFGTRLYEYIMNEHGGGILMQTKLERWQERQRRREIIADWKAYTKAIQAADPTKRMLMRDARQLSLTRIEDAARTNKDFDKLLVLWKEAEIIEEWRIRKQETRSTSAMLDYELPDSETIVPPPFKDIWWRQLLRGDFLDTLNDCPFHMEDFTTSRPVYIFIQELSEDQREILFYRAIRQWSPQKIAEISQQTDRNIRKVYNNMIADMRKKMYIRLRPRYIKGLALTNTQKAYMEWYWEQLSELEKGKLTRKFEEEERAKRKEAALLGGSDDSEVADGQFISKDECGLGEV